LNWSWLINLAGRQERSEKQDREDA
jgi:hypothetical protein